MRAGPALAAGAALLVLWWWTDGPDTPRDVAQVPASIAEPLATEGQADAPVPLPRNAPSPRTPEGEEAEQEAAPARSVPSPDGIATLGVRVLDSSGAPVAGVPLALSRLEHLDQRVPSSEAHTDAQGEARLPLEQKSWPELPASRRFVNVVRVALELQHVVYAELDVEDPPPWIELILPRLVRVRFVLEGVVWEDIARSRPAIALYCGEERRQVYLRLNGLEVESWVDPGLAYIASVSRVSHYRPWSQSFPAFEEGETLREHRVPLAARYPVLVGTLTLPDGTPASESAFARLECGDEYVNHGAGPEFRVPIDVDWSGGAPRTLRFVDAFGSDNWNVVAELDVSRELADEDYFVGDVQLQPLPALLQGKIHAGPGLPLSFPKLQLFRLAPGSEAWTLHRTRVGGRDCSFLFPDTTPGNSEPGERFTLRLDDSRYVLEPLATYARGERIEVRLALREQAGEEARDWPSPRDH